MHPEAQANCNHIWDRAASDGRKKYAHGQAEHKSKFWTAGAKWYLHESRAEALDLIAYLHQLGQSLEEIHALQHLMETGLISMPAAARCLKQIISASPPTKL